MHSLFPDSVIYEGQEDISHYDYKKYFVNCPLINHVHSVTRLPQRKDIFPNIVKQKKKIKINKINYVKGVSCVD